MSDNEESEFLFYWPSDWPGRSIVELDNLGDPGIWLEERLDMIVDVLSGDYESIQEVASMMADDYIIAAGEMSFPIPSDFECSDEECREMINDEFRTFLIEWRRKIEAARPQ